MKTFATIILTAICTWLLIGFVPPSVLDFEKVGKVNGERASEGVTPEGSFIPEKTEEEGGNWEFTIGEIDERELESLLFTALTRYRIEEGVKGIPISGYWQEKAKEHSQWMADNGRFEHSQLNNFENILLYTGWESEKVICKTAMESWKGSAGHNANLLEKGLNTCGLGVVQDGSCVFITFMAD